MLHIKSAQYMNMSMPPKALTQFDDGINELCQLCQENTTAGGEDFCEGCLGSGVIRQCNKCLKKTTEDDGADTSDGFVCKECYQDLYSGGNYMGPRQDYTGRVEGY